MTNKVNNNATTYTVPVAEDKAGCRLDRMLADAVPVLSRSRIKALIDGGRVTMGPGTPPVSGPSQKVRSGETYFISVPPPVPSVPQPQSIPLQVVYEDEHLIVIDKPAGLVVHPAAGHYDGTLVNALLAHCDGSLSGIGGVSRPGIVHRLDKDTSGLLVAAKTETAHQSLAAQFAEHSVDRAYQAVVWGVVNPRHGEISGNIGRSPRNRKKMAIVARGGKPSLTRYKVTATYGRVACLVECRLATGRTHQIRVHMTSLGHPIIGDAVYGGRISGHLRHATDAVRAEARAFNRQALHAYILGFDHPKTGDHLSFKSQLPNDIKSLISILGSL